MKLPSYDEGFVLPVVLVMLLMLTLLGISNMNMSSTELRIASNVQNKNTVFHAADSLAHRIYVSQQSGPLKIDLTVDTPQTFPATGSYQESDHADPPNTINVSAVVTPVVGDNGVENFACPATPGEETQLDIECQYWSIRATAAHADSGASSTVEQGVYKYAPR